MVHLLLITHSETLENKFRESFNPPDFSITVTDKLSDLTPENFPNAEVIVVDRTLLKNQVAGYINLISSSFIEIPILLVSDALIHDDVTAAFRAGAFDVIETETKTIILANTIHRAILKRQEWLGVKQLIEQLKLFNSNLQKKIDDLKNQNESNLTFTESIMEAIGAGLMTFDMTGKITFANSSAAGILGWSVENLINVDFNKILPIDADLGQIMDGSEYEKQYDVETLRGDGKKIRIGYTLFPSRNNRNDIVGMVCMFRDLFEIEKLREENRRLDKIATLGQIAAGIAHEVKNPLAAIRSIVQAISIDFAENDPHKQGLDQIFVEVDRINQILENSFAFSRTKKLNLTTISPVKIIQTVLSLLQADFNAKKVHVTFQIVNTIPDIRLDPTQIHQVLLNLIMNSVDAMPDGGNIYVQIEHAVAPKHIKGFVVISIRDTGDGIHKNDLQRIFDPFFTTKPHGTGLGLPITYKIIQDHMGKLDLSTEVGKGTLFTISLPD